MLSVIIFWNATKWLFAINRRYAIDPWTTLKSLATKDDGNLFPSTEQSNEMEERTKPSKRTLLAGQGFECKNAWWNISYIKYSKQIRSEEINRLHHTQQNLWITTKDFLFIRDELYVL